MILRQHMRVVAAGARVAMVAALFVPLAVVGVASSASATPGEIVTIAGNGTTGYSGDGGPATSAALWFPYGVTTDRAGNVYVSDYRNHAVRKIDSHGVITTVAGRGTAGYSGDGGQAASAQLNAPEGLVFDDAGNLYIADSANHRIRRIDPSGVITTIAGTGPGASAGDGGPATSAIISGPSGLAFDRQGHLYVAELQGERIRKIDTNGVITTVAGDGTSGFAGDGGPATQARFSTPRGLAVDAAGVLYIADYDNHRVRRVGLDGVISTFAGTGTSGFNGDGQPAITASLQYPASVVVDSVGAVYIADSDNSRVRKVTPDGNITTVAGTGTYGFSGDGGPATSANLGGPFSVWVADNGDLVIADAWGGRIRRVAAASPPMPATPAPEVVALPPAVADLINQPTPTTPSTAPSTTPPVTTTLPPPTTTTMPALQPGAAEVLIDGSPSTLEITTGNEGDLVMRGEGFEVSLRAECTSGCGLRTDSEGRQVIELQQNGTALVEGIGFSPGSRVEVWLFSEPTSLGELIVSAEGTFAGRVPLSGIEVGVHTLQVRGTALDGTVRTANLGVVVAAATLPTPAPGVLPATGVGTPALATVLLLTVLGASLVWLGRRRTGTARG